MGLSLGASYTNVPGGNANWTFTSASGNYNSQSDAVAIVIGKADATCTVNGYTGTYDAASHGAAGSCTGIASEGTLAGLTLGASYTNVPGGNANWTFASGNYNSQGDAVAIVIGKADATCTVNGYTGTYDAASHGATGSTGVASEGTLAGLTLGASYANVPGGNANWAFTSASGNYNSQGDAVAIVIGKADAICTVNGYTGTYDAASHGATGSCTGIASEGTLAGLTLGASYTNVPGGNANWAFTSASGNYNSQGSSVAIVIGKADATCTVNGYSGTYDAASHGATGSCTGIASEGALAGLSLGASYTNVPGGNANWSFTSESVNYNDQNNSVAVVINPAGSTTTVTCPNVTYNGAAQTPCTVSVQGPGLSLSPSAIYSNNLNAGSASASYTYLATPNHLSSTDAKTFTIAPAGVTANSRRRRVGNLRRLGEESVGMRGDRRLYREPRVHERSTGCWAGGWHGGDSSGGDWRRRRQLRDHER